MKNTALIQHRGVRLLAAVAAVALATAAPATASYGWPLKPFDRQHPVRGYFGDPRIVGRDEAHGTLHFGIDISGADGTPVYATLTGTVSIHPRHRDTVTISAGGVTHEYWHVIPAVRSGAYVVAGRTVVGHIEAPWAHVHFSETSGGCYVNPLRRGALAPYRDTTRPLVHHFGFERDGRGVGRTLRGAVDLVVEAWDETPLAVPAPWTAKPVTPALVRWRVASASGRALSAPKSWSWRVAADFRNALPRCSFGSVYARWTRQNHPWGRGGRGRYRFVLAHDWDSRSLPDGTYRLLVSVEDTRGNERVAATTFVVRNGRS